jgi:Zn-dependent peptidase ImmA (M78 family)
MYNNESLKIIAEKFPNINWSFVEKNSIVPVGEICEKLGLNVEFADLRPGLAGYLDRDSKTIYVNQSYSSTRNLFTVAHEIGHYILHNGLNNRYDQYHNYTDEELIMEWEANDFAGKLLMSRTTFINFFKQLGGDLKKIAYEFGVSQRAAEVRAYNLGLIDNI